MKKAGVDLGKHYQQVFDYWINLVPDRPQYVVLCNFDEFWVYDLTRQVYDPVDKVLLIDLYKRWEALAFLLPVEVKPIFGHDMIAVTREAAADMAVLFNTLVARGIDRVVAQTFVLQSVLTLFAEDIGLLPGHFYTRAIEECIAGGSSYLTLFGLFREMNTPGVAGAGPYAGTPYFNGGLFAEIHPFDLTVEELELLNQASITDWALVRPAIFGTIFEDTRTAADRHKYGQHFTDEADIMRVVGPTITHPWLDRIASAQTLRELGALETELFNYRVLDPACGCGNFLYLAYRELRRVEKALHDKHTQMTTSAARRAQARLQYVSPSHFYGVDISPFAIEIAKMTLMLAKKLAADDLGDAGSVLPLDDLSTNFWATDALDPSFVWPPFDACIGNPPYLGRQKLQHERGASYLHALDSWFPDVKGKADYVVYWFRLANDRLGDRGRAGFVATDSIREGASKVASLDYIVGRGATITEAVSSQKWPGTADVNVSIVNWIKGEDDHPKTLVLPDGTKQILPFIGPTLSDQIDLTGARRIAANTKPKRCFQGQTPGHDGFVLNTSLAKRLCSGPCGTEVIRPFLTGKELNATGRPERWIIDFDQTAKAYAERAAPEAFAHIKDTVLPYREAKARGEASANAAALVGNPNARVNRHNEQFLSHWWQLSWRRNEMLAAIAPLTRYIGMSRYAIRSRMSIYAYIDTHIRPMDKVVVFAFDDDYSFGVLQSNLHRRWFENRASLGQAISYTNQSAFDTFPWPQDPSAQEVTAVAAAASRLLEHRQHLLADGIRLGQMYDALRTPGSDLLLDLHLELDNAVSAAYHLRSKTDPVLELLKLNRALAEDEVASRPVRGAGADGLPGIIRLTDFKIAQPEL
jgi:SAM-dependent methyltransferase